MPTTKRKILVVDDKQQEIETLRRDLGDAYMVDGVTSVSQARRYAPDADLVLLDVRLPAEDDGLNLLEELREKYSNLPIIMLTAFANMKLSIECLRRGATDFIPRPFSDGTDLKKQIEKALKNYLSPPAVQGTPEEIIGISQKIIEVRKLIALVALVDHSVLITGESGTGKELVARAIHRLSRRSEKPIVPVNVAAISDSLVESQVFGHEKGAFTGAVGVQPGYFELANTGTLFLDEIGEMPMHLQPKLLRVLEDGKVRRLGGKHEFKFDVRIIAATNRPPREAIGEGKLREDLYYRLKVFDIEIAPLRNRREDISVLAQHFIHHQSRTMSRNFILEPDAIDTLLNYDWPGNVRELENEIQRACALAQDNRIRAANFNLQAKSKTVSGKGDGPLNIQDTRKEAERELIEETLSKTDGNVTKAAKILGIARNNLHKKMKSLGIAKKAGLP